MTQDPLRTTSTKPSLDRGQALQISAAVVLLLCMGGVGVAAALVENPPIPLDVVVVGIDASLTSDVETRCKDLLRIAIDAMDRAEGDLRLIVLASGDGATAMQPDLMGTASLKRRRGLVEVDLEGPRMAFLAQVEGFCEAIPVRTESPLLQLVQAALDAAAPPAGAGSEVTGRVVIRTDGIEEVDEILTAAIQARAGWNTALARRAIPDEMRPKRLDTAVTPVELCGLSARRVKPGRLPPPGLTQVGEAWHPEATEKKGLRFAATCAPGVDSSRVADATEAPDPSL